MYVCLVILTYVDCVFLFVDGPLDSGVCRWVALYIWLFE